MHSPGPSRRDKLTRKPRRRALPSPQAFPPAAPLRCGWCPRLPLGVCRRPPPPLPPLALAHCPSRGCAHSTNTHTLVAGVKGRSAMSIVAGAPQPVPEPRLPMQALTPLLNTPPLEPPIAHSPDYPVPPPPACASTTHAHHPPHHLRPTCSRFLPCLPPQRLNPPCPTTSTTSSLRHPRAPPQPACATLHTTRVLAPTPPHHLPTLSAPPHPIPALHTGLTRRRPSCQRSAAAETALGSGPAPTGNARESVGWFGGEGGGSGACGWSRDAPSQGWILREIYTFLNAASNFLMYNLSWCVVLFRY